MKKEKAFPAMLILSFLIIVLGFAIQEHFFISDQFERARATESIMETGFIGLETDAFGLGLQKIYAPLFDVLSSGIALVTGLPLLSVWKLLGMLAFAIIAFFSFKTALMFLPKEHAYFVSALTVMMPWLFRRLLNAIPETLGLMFFSVSLYFLLKKDFVKLALIFSAFALFHYRSFLTFGLLFLVFSAYFLWKKEITIKQIALPVITSLISLVWIFPRLDSLLATQRIINPWIQFMQLHEIFSVLFFAALILALFLIYKKKYFLFTLPFFVGILIHSLFQPGIFAMRTGVYLFAFIPLILVLGIKELKPRISTRLGLGLLSFGFFWLLVIGHSFVFEPSYFSDENIKALEALKEIEGEKVLSDFIGSYTIPYVTQKKVVIGAFMESVPEANQRLSETFNAFQNCSFAETMKKFDAQILHISPLSSQIFNCNTEKIEKEQLKLVLSHENNYFYVLNRSD